MSNPIIQRIESKLDNLLGIMGTFPQQYAWCKQQFGPEGARWTARVVPLPYTFEFADEEDALLFALRWS